MSKPRPDLSVKVEDIHNYVEWLSTLPLTAKIGLTGSRASANYRDDSDWDLILVSNVSHRVVLPPPRDTRKIHADLLVLPKTQDISHLRFVELWPNDVNGIFEQCRTKS